MSSKKPDIQVDAESAQNPTCGLVMPISTIDGCPEQHWAEVKSILCDVIDSAGFSPNMVSDADDVGIIQKRIIQNLYENPIVVCDVSGKNPNVMFELGMRLAFDKPTIIVKDDKTSYSFDTSPIEHLEYPRDLRFSRIIEFKKALRDKIEGTHRKSTSDSNYTTFLKNFGHFTVAKLETKEVSKEEYILTELAEVKTLLTARFAEEKDRLIFRKASPRRLMPISVVRKALTARGNPFKEDASKLVDEIREEIMRQINVSDYFHSPLEFEMWLKEAISECSPPF